MDSVEMPLSTSPLAFSHVRSILERALDAPRGIKVKLSTHAEAVRLRQQLSRYRAWDRKQNCRVYPDPESPNHNASVYDMLELRIPKKGESGDNVLVIIQKAKET